MDYSLEKTDLSAHQTAQGMDFYSVNKSYTPLFNPDLNAEGKFEAPQSVQHARLKAADYPPSMIIEVGDDPDHSPI